MNVLITVFAIFFIFLLCQVVIINTKIDILLNKNNKNEDNKSINHETTLSSFQDGINEGFRLVQVALYKMWVENDLLDFENINEDIKNNIYEITKNPELLKKWKENFMEYLKQKNQESSGNE